MAELLFHITPGILPPSLLEKSFFAAWGRLPRPTQATLADNLLTIRTETKGSGTVHVLCPHRELGIVLQSTETLLAQETPYLLTKELARGSLGRMLRKIFDWQLIGFRLSPESKQKITEVSRRFSKCVVADESDPEVERELWQIMELFDETVLWITHEFAEQSLAWRLKNEDRLPTVFGVGMHSHPIESLYEFDLYAHFLQEAFHVVMPMPSWRELEPEPGCFQWERLEKRFTYPARFGFQILMGPLLTFDIQAFPTWLLPRIGEPGFFENNATRFVNALTERYGSTTYAWILANHVNSCAIADLPTSRCVSLIRILAQQIRSRGLDSPILIGINQPWGEYSLDHVPEYDQVQIAESLMGCRDIDAFLLEMNFGFDRHQTLPHDPMSISGMIDQWSMLGKKLYASISVPSSISSGFFGQPMPVSEEYQWSEGMQQRWTDLLLKILLARRPVHGIFWNQLQDAEETLEDTKSMESHLLPNGGLIDSQRVLKLAFKHFVNLRSDVLR